MELGEAESRIVDFRRSELSEVIVATDSRELIRDNTLGTPAYSALRLQKDCH